MTSPLKATSIGWLIISVGHVLGAKEWQSNPQFRALPGIADTCARVGWYQGSAFFLVNVCGAALINYNWSLAPEQLRNPLNKAAAIVMALSMLGSSAGYFKGGVNKNGFVVAVVGALQAWAALRE
ncbi:hypothetical protein BDW74DRAFT_80329 [Aspergillus multicolor]|uniref:uncharacterized protein n=1 Tax=Aspergillus multicolor TaxID=41759 RepID=UPI003CCDAC4B